MKVIFVVAHKYYKQYKSYLQNYVDNIQKIYGNDGYVLIVDNNSIYINDIQDIFKGYQNVSIIINDTPCKFEIGAYKKGIEYILENNLFNKFAYYIFTQDNFILNRKFDFTQHKILARTLYTWPSSDIGNVNKYSEIYIPLVKKMGLEHVIPHRNICWCSSFILHQSRVMLFYDLTFDIILTTRKDSEIGERYLSIILYKLNNDKMESIDGECNPELVGNKNTIDVYDKIPPKYFIKCNQQKTENTLDL